MTITDWTVPILEVQALDTHVRFDDIEVRSVGPVWFWGRKKVGTNRCMVKLRLQYVSNCLLLAEHPGLFHDEGPIHW